MTFVEGEQPLSSWMAENAYVSWVVCGRPWELDDESIAELDLPLNLQGTRTAASTPPEGARQVRRSDQGPAGAA